MSPAGDASNIDQLINENLQPLSQLIQLITQLSEDQYRHRFGLQGLHSTGKHVRHIVDHYQAFLLGLDEKATHINYENRQREEMIETRPGLACRRLLTICRSLEQLGNDDHHLSVLLDYPTVRKSVEINSSVGRELVFLSSHTIHHMAIIGLLAEQLGVPSGSSFGVHPSTLRYWQSQGSSEIDFST